MLKTTMVPSDLAKVVISTQVTTATVQTYHNGDIQNLLAAVSGSGLWVGCLSSAKPLAPVFSSRSGTGVAAALVSGVSKVDGVEPTATQMTVVTAYCH